MTAAIEAVGLSVGYGGSRLVHGLDLHVDRGEVVALLGANGAGKTTTLLALAGELRPMAGQARVLDSTPAAPLHRRARRGMSFVTEDRSVFMGLTTRQNLALAGCDVDRVCTLFPELEPLLSRRAGLLSGGEQQMLTLGRALARDPQALLADELSLGLAPKTVGRLLQAVRGAADGGMAALVVEQHVHRALEIADRVYLLRNGRLAYSGTAAEARERLSDIEAHYLTAAR